MKTTDFNLLQAEYKKLIDWKDIYQWKRVKSKGNTEIISEWLIRDFNKITFDNKGLREGNFKINNHQGYCELQTPIEQFTEKRFCRALYNRYNKNQHPLLGLILDYEVPLTAPNQTSKVNQGEIDLVSARSNEILLIEAKIANSTESLLKAILEIFVYITRMAHFGLLKQFQAEYKKEFSKLTPCVLTFIDSTSGKQIIEINKFPKLLELITKINLSLRTKNLKGLEFYLVETPDSKNSNILVKEWKIEDKPPYKILLKREVEIKQYFPNYISKTFQNKLDNNTQMKEIEMLLHSFLLYFRLNAIQYINDRISSVISKFETYFNTDPKNEKITLEFNMLFKEEEPFIDAYLNIANQYKYKEFLNINLKLLNPSNFKVLVPIISHFKSDEILEKLIEAYNNIKIIRTKDYDGVTASEIDLADEEIIISALCQYNNPKIIPLLKDSILKGNIGTTKSLVINKLLTFISKEKILELIPDLSDSNMWMVAALTNKKKNADWVIKYLNEL